MGLFSSHEHPVCWIWCLSSSNPRPYNIKIRIPQDVRIANCKGKAYILYMKKKPCGFITFKTWKMANLDCCLVDRLYISPVYRGNGYAKLLVSQTANQTMTRSQMITNDPKHANFFSSNAKLD